MNVKLIKLVSGEEFIAEIVSVNSESFSFKNGVKLGMTEDGVAMLPFNPLIKKDYVVVLNYDHITFCIDIIEQFENAYKSNFGGIVTTASKILTSL